MKKKTVLWGVALVTIWVVYEYRYPIMLWIGKTLLLQAIEVR